MQIPLGAAGGHVSPVGIGFHLPQFGEEVDDAAFELTTVYSVIALDEGISEVVDTVLHKLVQFGVIVHQVVGVAEMHRGFPLEEFVVDV